MAFTASNIAMCSIAAGRVGGAGATTEKSTRFHSLTSLASCARAADGDAKTAMVRATIVAASARVFPMMASSMWQRNERTEMCSTRAELRAYFDDFRSRDPTDSRRNSYSNVNRSRGDDTVVADSYHQRS